MKRLLYATGALLLGIMLSGCSSDPREGLVDATVGDIETAATKVQNIKSKIDAAIKNTEAGKTPDFKEALQEADALKKIGKEMQEYKIRADALRGKASEEERQELTERIKPRLNKAIDRAVKATRELNETLASVDAQYKDALKPLRDKLSEANGEFEVIARQRY
jgi:hypothetical protein